MAKVSIIIPARNEIYLEKTIRSILESAQDDIEIIVVLDGYVPDPQIDVGDKRVVFLHYKESIGQRAAINAGVKHSSGKYILKTDGHSLFDKGFDVKLQSDCEYDWTVIPRMYNLDVEAWKPKKHKWTDYMYISSPDSEKPFRAFYCPYSEQVPKRNIIIDDVMTSQGACWFMHKDRFLDLGGMDEEHGGWGQVGVEIALKAWLSGGRLIVNKKTWFSHWFRGGSAGGFPYPISGNTVERARRYSRNLWLNNRWDKQVKNLDWLVSKFNPKGWDMNDLTILYYTANVVSKKIEEVIVRSLKRHNYPIISISQEPMDLGRNICVGQIGKSLQNIYKQVLIGAKESKTKYVALCEDDCLYTSEHFEQRPKTFSYNLNRWLLHLEDTMFTYRKRACLSQCVADREELIKNLEERFKLENIPDKYCGEMGVFDKRLGMKEYSFDYFETKTSNLVICHKDNTMGRKLWGKDAKPRQSIPTWGEANYWVKKLGSIKKFGRGAKPTYQHSYIGSIILSMDELYENRRDYVDARKKESFELFDKAFPPFIQAVHEGKQFTNEELRNHLYFDYLVTKLNPKDRNPLTGKGGRHCLNLMKDAIRVYNDIKSIGLKAPLDMWRTSTGLVLNRGGRRLEILKILDYKVIPIRLFKTKEHFRKFNPSKAWIVGDIKTNSIHNLAVKQFTKLLHKATDKYWVHGYTRLYDKHISHLRKSAKSVLEIGVFRGASLLLWKEAFPNAQIYGIDKNTAIWQEFLAGQKRIEVFVGHQEDKKFLVDKVIPKAPFDIIIDDGGHKPLEQQSTFSMLWDSLVSGGMYVIEDLYGNYRKERIKDTTMRVLKDMVDDIHLKINIKSIHFYYNICFIEKA